MRNIQLKLDPSSGYSDSYFDIEFTVNFGQCDKAYVKIYNASSKQQLNILGTSNGVIFNQNEIIVENTTMVSGYINLFNGDKTNKNLRGYSKIEIRFEIEIFNNNQIESYKSSTFFLNENNSLDADIIPFDFNLLTTHVNVDNNEPVKFEIISTSAQNFELSIGTEDQKLNCVIEVSAMNGRTYINVPIEFLYHDLNLKINKLRKFQVFYIKRRGITFSRLSNRIYVPIPNTQLSFSASEEITPLPQSRKGPTNQDLDDNFIISDRYLVICPKQYSNFASKSSIHSSKLFNLSFLVNESQHMDKINKSLTSYFDNKIVDKITETGKKIRSEDHHKTEESYLLASVSANYDRRFISGLIEKVAEVKSNQSTNKIDKQNSKPGCSKCSRSR